MRKLLAGVFAFIILSSLLVAQPNGAPGGGPGGERGAPPPPPPPSRGAPPSFHPGHSMPGSGSGGSSGSSGSSGGSYSGSSSSGTSWNYRGKRTSAVSSPLEVVGKTVLYLKSRLQLVIQFNQAIDPTKLDLESIVLNGEILPLGTKLKFNKKADSVTLTFIDDFISEEDLKSATIMLRNIQTFDGKSVEELEVK